MCFKGVSRKIEGCLNGILYGFQRCEKKFNDCLREVSKMFYGCFEKVFREFQGTWRGVLGDLYR